MSLGKSVSVYLLPVRLTQEDVRAVAFAEAVLKLIPHLPSGPVAAMTEYTWPAALVTAPGPFRALACQLAIFCRGERQQQSQMLRSVMWRCTGCGSAMYLRNWSQRSFIPGTMVSGGPFAAPATTGLGDSRSARANSTQATIRHRQFRTSAFLQQAVRAHRQGPCVPKRDGMCLLPFPAPSDSQTRLAAVAESS